MSGFADQVLVETILIYIGFAFSQYVVLRAGVFSVATVGLAGIGGYTAGLCSLRLDFPYPLALLCAIILPTAVSLVLGMALVRLRGIFQAVATLAFVLILNTLMLEISGLTGGSLGLNGIPQETEFWQLVVAVLVMTFILVNLGRGRIGRAFDAMASDEAAAATHGIDVQRYQFLAFGLSGAFAGLAGGLLAFQNYSVEPSLFGFTPSLNTVIFVALGGALTVIGPIVGTIVFLGLPEVARSFAEYKNIIVGVVLILVVIYLPSGIADSLILFVKERLRRRKRSVRGVPEAARPEGDPPPPEQPTASVGG
jgi:branched-chain amino acid transport system permease protein